MAKSEEDQYRRRRRQHAFRSVTERNPQEGKPQQHRRTGCRIGEKAGLRHFPKKCKHIGGRRKCDARVRISEQCAAENDQVSPVGERLTNVAQRRPQGQFSGLLGRQACKPFVSCQSGCQCHCEDDSCAGKTVLMVPIDIRLPTGYPGFGTRKTAKARININKPPPQAERKRQRVIDVRSS